MFQKCQCHVSHLGLSEPLWPGRCRWTSSQPSSFPLDPGSCLDATAEPASCTPWWSPSSEQTWDVDTDMLSLTRPNIKVRKHQLWRLLPLDSQDLVVVSLLGLFQKPLGSLQAFFNLTVVFTVFCRCLVVPDGWEIRITGVKPQDGVSFRQQTGGGQQHFTRNHGDFSLLHHPDSFGALTCWGAATLLTDNKPDDWIINKQ